MGQYRDVTGHVSTQRKAVKQKSSALSTEPLLVQTTMDKEKTEERKETAMDKTALQIPLTLSLKMREMP